MGSSLLVVTFIAAVNWKGDPNAALSGRDSPKIAPGVPSPPATIATTQYDPVTGLCLGPDGHIRTQTERAQGACEQPWRRRLFPCSTLVKVRISQPEPLSENIVHSDN